MTVKRTRHTSDSSTNVDGREVPRRRGLHDNPDERQGRGGDQTPFTTKRIRQREGEDSTEEATGLQHRDDVPLQVGNCCLVAC